VHSCATRNAQHAHSTTRRITRHRSTCTYSVRDMQDILATRTWREYSVQRTFQCNAGVFHPLDCSGPTEHSPGSSPLVHRLVYVPTAHTSTLSAHLVDWAFARLMSYGVRKYAERRTENGAQWTPHCTPYTHCSVLTGQKNATGQEHSSSRQPTGAGFLGPRMRTAAPDHRVWPDNLVGQPFVTILLGSTHTNPSYSLLLQLLL
jgi:hypothetical protein